MFICAAIKRPAIGEYNDRKSFEYSDKKFCYTVSSLEKQGVRPVSGGYDHPPFLYEYVEGEHANFLS